MPDVTTVRQIRVMISSTRVDLSQYREEASKLIKNLAAEKEKRVQLREISMEKETQSGDREFAVQVSKRWVEEADWIVLIVGWNYGTVSDEEGANGLSVTEWEYRHAEAKRKQIFVYIAGEPKTATAYRVSPDETFDLKDSIPEQGKEQTKKLERFKKDLRKAHVDFFRDLAHFRQRLEQTLRDAIDDLPPDIRPGSRLAELFVAATPAIRKCIRQVNLIADCKRIHDHLHELRQQVIRRLREEVLPGCREAGALDPRKDGFISKRSNMAERQLGAIHALQNSIPAENEALLNTIGALLKLPQLWDAEADPRPSVEEFSEAVDDFAAAVQATFTAADDAMRHEERALDNLHAAVLESISDARRDNQLSPSEERNLDDELRKIADNKTRLAAALAKHHDWQRVHDRLELFNGYRELAVFSNHLKRFINTGLKNVLALVDRELALTNISHGVINPSEVSDELVKGVPLSAAECRTNRANGATELRGLKEQLAALPSRNDVEAFDAMRLRFDDVFYCIDKCTLDDVERSRERVVAFENLLEDLAKTKQKAA